MRRNVVSHYKSNVRDQVFNLFEVFGVDQALGQGEYSDLDVDTAQEMLSEISRLAEGPVAESFVDGDRNPPTFDPETHSVTLPESFKESVRAVTDAGWDKAGIDEALGGMPMPKALLWALHEHILGANPAVWMYGGGAGFANILYHRGTEEQKKWAVLAAERGWGSTMVLTEPDAGSDVGAGRTKAVQQDDGSWHIDGVKRFITSGDSGDLFENIFHLVLARPEGAGPGTKGLSLFFVPKFLFDFETGELGERNGVFVTNVEHKMGLKVSATCELSFGQHGVPAKGWLVGEVHNGIAQMFEVIEQARMLVGTKANAKLTESLQTFGGSGFLQDYPIEQYIRDAKIDSLYEGTTAIQAQDFFFRKIVRDKGVALAHVSEQIQRFVDSESGNGRLKTERELLGKALTDVQAMAATLTGYLMAAQEDVTSLYKVGLGSVRFLMSVGDLVIGWLLQRHAAVAVAALDAGASGAERSFYEGKVAVASFFAKNF